MILIFSGTKDGRNIVNELLEKGYKVIISTATIYGAELIKKNNNLEIIYGKLDVEEIKELIEKRRIRTVIDATHPYAQNISKNIISVCKQTETELIRYERPSMDIEDIKRFDSYEEICNFLNLKSGNILLTTGSNNINKIAEQIDKKDRLFARVLPAVKSLEVVRQAGLKPKQVIAMQGPFTKELNKAIYNQFDIEYMVTKDSGDEGGTKEKIDAALEQNVDILMLNRPKIKYINLCNSINEVLEMI